jgi:DNA-binding IclR family transcriptional regulator
MQIKGLHTLLAIKVLALGLAPGLKANYRRVGIVLLEHFNRRNGRCDPGLGRVARLLAISERTVMRANDRLERAGLFRKVRHGGFGNRNSYEPLWARFQTLEDAWRSKLAERRNSAPSELSPNTRQACHFAGDSAVTQTCTTNQSQSTCSSGRPNKRMEGVEIRSNANSFGHRSADAARNEAERRWNRDLDERFRSMPVTYPEIVDAITPAIHAAATDAELRRRGAGLDYIVKQLKLGDR